jgi:hypothetical protein
LCHQNPATPKPSSLVSQMIDSSHVIAMVGALAAPLAKRFGGD